MSEHSLFNSLLTLRASNISVFHYLPLQEKNENLTIRLHASSKAGFIQDLITNRKILRQVSKVKFAGFLISRNQLIYANDLTAKSKYSIFHLHIPFYWFKTQLWRRTSSSTPAYKLKCCAIRINRVYLLTIAGYATQPTDPPRNTNISFILCLNYGILSDSVPRKLVIRMTNSS